MNCLRYFYLQIYKHNVLVRINTNFIARGAFPAEVFLCNTPIYFIVSLEGLSRRNLSLHMFLYEPLRTEEAF